MQKILIAAAVIAQAADIITTQAVLGAGGWEANPLMAWAQGSLGGAWIVPKLAVLALMVWVMKRRWKPRAAAAVVTLAMLPPVSNVVSMLIGL